MQRLFILLSLAALMAGCSPKGTATTPPTSSQAPASVAVRPPAEPTPPVNAPEANAPAANTPAANAPEANAPEPPASDSGTASTGKPEKKPAAKDSAAVRGARKTIDRLQQVKSMSEFAEMLTNESAASVAFPLYMMGAMPMTASGGEALQKKVAAIAQRYQLSGKPDFSANSHGLVVKKGRAFMKDVTSVLAGIEGSPFQNGLGPLERFRSQVVEKASGLVYKRLDGKRVEISYPGEPQTIEARLEDGKWRLHLANFDEMLAQMRAGATGQPPGGPPPGGPPPGR